MTFDAEYRHDSPLDWTPVFEPATQRASDALRRWTRDRVTLSLDEVRETSLAETAAALPAGDEPLTMVIVGVVGELSGCLILMLDDESVVELVGVLLNRALKPTAEWGELELSALRETGNIFGSAYLNAVSERVGSRLFPSPPNIVRDYAAGALEQAVVMQAIDSDQVLFCRTQLCCAGSALNVTAFFVPTGELLSTLRRTLEPNTLEAR